mmetsp:Transcript_36234/g.109558  ORF Transcript_36234/g.109558 Transcript_36234/m.109558 type:complete len:250 (+) Transcript_36234:317-1066(+)
MPPTLGPPMRASKRVLIESTSCHAWCARSISASKGTVATPSAYVGGGPVPASASASSRTPRRTRSGFASLSKDRPCNTLKAASMTRGAWPSFSAHRTISSMAPAAAICLADVRDNLSKICRAACTGSPMWSLITKATASTPLSSQNSRCKATRSRSATIAKRSLQMWAQCGPSRALIANADKALPSVASPGAAVSESTRVAPSPRRVSVALGSEVVSRRTEESGRPVPRSFLRRSWSAAHTTSVSVSWL